MLTTMVGNYPKIPNRPRPAKLRAAIARFDRGEATREELDQVADDVTIEAIQEQVDAGLDIITDGQIRWEDDQTYLAGKLAGFSINGLIRYFDTNTYYRQPVVAGPVGWKEPITVRDYQFAVAHSPKPVKAILPGPYTLAALSQNQHYSRIEDLALDLARALGEEAQALVSAGATMLQINEPAILKSKSDFTLLAKALGLMLSGVNVETALYTWFGDIEGIYPQILELPVNTIGLDMVIGSANMEIIRRATFTKKLGLGIMDARNTKLETVDYVAGKIREASQIVPLERIYLNPSCGLEYLPRETAQAKLALMVEGARRVQEVLR